MDCEDGDVRLSNGTNALEGRVEVCFNRAWGTVCSNGFDLDEAEVICNQLSVPYKGQLFLLHVELMWKLLSIYF